MLNFAEKGKTKISYAASFGLEKWEAPVDITLQAKKWLSQFNAISVREESGKTICRESFGIDECCVVLDPTFLLTRLDYDKIADSDIQSLPSGKYAVCMMLDSKNFESIYDKIEKKIGMPLFPLKGRTYNFPFVSFTRYNTIEHWLNLIRNAEYVITDSFHCMVFSIIFHKEFFVVINKSRGAARIYDIANTFGFSERIYTDISDLLILSPWNNKIDYLSLDTELKQSKNFSIIFLLNAIKNTHKAIL